MWRPAQLHRLEASGVPRSVDVHCHCLPRLDDGPATLEEAVELCDALAEDGFTTVVATPHQLGPYGRRNSPGRVRRRVEELRKALDDAEVPLEVLAGADIRIDERLVGLVGSDGVTTLADRGEWLLLELPHTMWIDPAPVIRSLAKQGVRVVMTHPERHRFLDGKLQVVSAWRRSGAAIQLTAGSLLGDFGDHAYDSAWSLIEAGLVDLVATDAHDSVRRPPRMTEAIAVLSERIGAERATRLTAHNPLRLIEGRPLATPPTAERTPR